MMTGSKLVKDAVGSPLNDAGFTKRSDSWYWTNDEVVMLVNLQKSQYGDQYYVNCGVALKSLTAADFPKEHHCHIRFRLTAVVDAEKAGYIEAVFDMENELFSEPQRKQEISGLIKDVALPILRDCSSESGIAEMVKNGKFAKAMVHKQVKKLLAGVTRDDKITPFTT